MSCLVNRDSKNNIVKVIDNEGKESKLFSQIVSHPLVESKEIALNIYKNVFTNKIETGSEFVHKVSDTFTSSYKEALNIAFEGEQIEIGFSNEKGFTPIIKTIKTTNKDSEKGYINNLIVNGLLSDVKVKSGIDYYFSPNATTDLEQAVKAGLIQQDAYTYLGFSGVKRTGNYFTFEKTKGRVKVLDKNGNSLDVNPDQIDTLSYQELDNKYSNAAELIAEREYFSSRNPFGKSNDISKTPTVKRTENDLQIRLLSLLNKMGVKITSITEYVKKYNLKNGVNPSASALADIANQIIAYSGNEISLEDLTEETSHFLIEAFDREKTNQILQQIENTEQYIKYAPIYRTIYQDEYSNEEDLEQAVRREVLGKILSESIKNRFLFNEQTGSITQSLRNLFENFIDYIKSIFQSSFKTELDTYIKELTDIVYTEDISDKLYLDNFKNNKYRLYSAIYDSSPESKIQVRAAKLIDNLNDQVKVLLRAGAGSRTDQKTLEVLNKNLEEGHQLEAVSGIVTLTNHYVKRILKSIEQAKLKNKSYFLSDEENIIYQNLKHNLRDTLSEIKVILGDKKGSDWNTIKNSIQETVNNIQDLISEGTILDTKNVERLADEILEKHNIGQDKRQEVKDWIEKAESDTNWFHATFGQMIHAKDGLINLMGTSIRKMRNNATTEWVGKVKNLQTIIEQNGLTEADISQFFDNGYILHQYDKKRFQDDLDKAYAENYKKVSGSDLSVEDIIIKKRSRELDILSAEQEAELRQANKASFKDYIERVYVDQYYKKYEESLKDLSNETKTYLNSYFADLSSLKAKAIEVTSDGKTTLNFQNLSPQDREDLSKLHRGRYFAKSYIDLTGELKKGLSYSFDKDGTIITDDKGKPAIKINKDTASTQAIVAWELNQMDSNFKQTEESKSLERFYQELEKVDKDLGREEAIKFLELNSYIGFKDTFWNNFSSNINIVDRLLVARDQNEEYYDEITDLINSLKQQSTKLRGILKLFQKKNMPSEIDVEAMDTTSKDTVRQIQENLKELYSKAYQFTDGVDINTDQTSDTQAATTANESYINELKSLGIYRTVEDSLEQGLLKINQEIEFARDHMTSENKRNIYRDIAVLEQYRQGTRSNLNRSLLRTLQDNNYSLEDIQNDSDYMAIMEYHVRSKLLPYYKRFAPEGFDIFLEGLQLAEQGKLSEYVRESVETDIFDFLEIEPNYSFFDSKQDNQRNPNYIEGYKGGYLQPKMSKYRNEKFFNLFGTVTENPDGTKTASKNQNLFNVYNAYLDFHFESLEAMGMDSSYDFYLAPQIRKNTLERVTKFLKRPSTNALKNAFKDFSSFTEDDMAKGDTRFGDSVKVIPKMYTQRLENPEDISTELFYSTALMAKEAYLRKTRVEAYGDLMSIYDKVLTRDYNGKPVESTQTYKMVKSAIDYNLFGVKEIRTLPVSTPFGTVDVAKIARNFLNFIKFRNLGFNIIIPATSAITAKVFQKIEVLQRDYLHPRSQKLATTEFRRLSTEGVKEVGKINTKAKINVLGQYFRAFNLEESLENSNYGWIARAMPRVGMMLHSMANFPIYGQNLISVLHDFRVVDGQIINYNSFKNINNGLSKKELDTKWSAYENSVFYNFIEVKDGQVIIDKNELETALSKTGNELDTYIKDSVNTIQQYVSNLNEFIDGQISEDDKVYASRDAIMNYFMTHRGWLSIATSKRFKHRHINFATGVEEEGSYRSAWNFLGKYLSEFNSKNIANVIKNGKEVWNKTDGVGKNNIKRVMIEMAVLNSLLILGYMLNRLADDDKNKELFALQLSNYLMLRTVNELSSSQLALGRNYSEIIDSPFVGWNTAKEMTNIMDVFSGEEVKYGNYRGMTESGRWLTKMIPGVKQIHDLQNINQTKNTYLFYNNNNFKYTPLGTLDWSNKEK